MNQQISVLIVDDSRLFRAALEEALAGQPDIRIVGSVFSGTKALEFIAGKRPDVVTLDVEMPGLDGLATLERIQASNAGRPADDTVGVIMVSAHTRRGADVTVRALQSGAFDFVTKPSGPSREANLALLRDEALPRIRACAAQRRKRAAVAAPLQPALPRADVPVAPRRAAAIRLIAIGTSTGGPRALAALLPELCARVSIPILIVQHMPAEFTQSLAESLARQTKRKVVEAADGMTLSEAAVFVAPGGRHLLLRGPAATPGIGLSDTPPENGCRPAADVLFRSVAATLGKSALGIILTGMGSDGTAGLAALKRAGGYVIAQDEASSVVWGMPGSVVQARLADEVAALPDIARVSAAIIERGLAD